MIEVLTSQGRRERSRPRSIELSSQGKDQARRQVMRKTRRGRRASFFGVNFFDADFTGAAPSSISRSSVHENNGVDVADAFCQLWRELMQAQNFDLQGGKLAFQRVGHAPGKAVVGAQRISVGDDEHTDSHTSTRSQARLLRHLVRRESSAPGKARVQSHGGRSTMAGA